MKAQDFMVAVIKPNAEFVVWLAQLPVKDSFLSLECQREDCISILIPQFETWAEVKIYFKDIYLPILKKELEIRVHRSFWPGELSYQLFEKWFEVELHSRVFFLSDFFESSSQQLI